MIEKSPLVWTHQNSPAQDRRGTEFVRRGVRARKTRWHALAPWERYRERVRAATIALADPLLGWESAASELGLPVFGEPRYVHVFADIAGHSYRQKDVLTHTGVDGREETRINGVRVTTLVDTVVDLIRVLPLAFGVATLDAALRMGANLDEIADRLRAQRNPRGRSRAWDAVRRADAAAESVLESVSRVMISLLGFEDPELQRTFLLDDRERRPDFYWPSVGVAGDADGDEKYFRGDILDAEAKIRDQRRRDIELQVAVERSVHWEWGDVMTPARLDRILIGAGVPRIRPVDPRVIASIANGGRTVRRPRH
ncbi:hypothetical protein [Microbacterium stercoris]|uniref:Uncharacterized protein n=1 Tax=Microbacterium stercoris TaxID=2820289 RepID=A0A939QJ27_9MICO|nr:hypothetical protein [Microbacterium stercoris]MBO3662607.1 hypothetical protein [Microbacterium stercoris]